MKTDPPSKPSADATPAFEDELRAVLLAAFGRGITVETTWEIDSAVSDAPNWRVTIEKVPPAESTYDPSLLEE